MNDGSPDPTRVVGAYLDEMLREATGEGATRPRGMRPAPPLLPEQLLAPADSAPTEAPPSERGREPTEAVAHRSDAAPPPGRPAPRGTDAGAAPGGEAARPDPEADPASAYRFPLQCLMFRLGPHLLAIPLTRLGGVHKRTQAPTRLPGSPPWLLGMLDIRGARLRVADSLCLLTGLATEAEYIHLLVLDDGRWAITCDAIEEVVDVDEDDVKWCASQLRIGTIRRSLAGLLDPSAIVDKLEAAAGADAGARGPAG